MTTSGTPPAYAKPALNNVYDRRDFNCTLRFGASALASFGGKDLVGSRVTAGQFKVALPCAFRQRSGFKWGWGKYAAGAVYFPVILTDNSNVEADPCLIVETRTEAGVATDPATGNELDLEFSFSGNVLNDEYDGV